MLDEVQQKRQCVFAGVLAAGAVAMALEAFALLLHGDLIRVGDAAADDPPPAAVGGRLDGAEPALAQDFAGRRDRCFVGCK
jgi:hypothetical protein